MTDDKNKKICTSIKVEFKRNNRTYIKDLYIIMTEDMKSNIKKKGIFSIFQTLLIFASPHNVNL